MFAINPLSYLSCLSLMEGFITYCCTLMFMIHEEDPTGSHQPFLPPLCLEAALLLSSHVLCACWGPTATTELLQRPRHLRGELQISNNWSCIIAHQDMQ